MVVAGEQANRANDDDGGGLERAVVIQPLD